jgi:hypothetical protein
MVLSGRTSGHFTVETVGQDKLIRELSCVETVEKEAVFLSWYVAALSRLSA